MVVSVLTGCENNPVEPEQTQPEDSVSGSVSDSLSVPVSDSLSTVVITFTDAREGSFKGFHNNARLIGENIFSHRRIEYVENVAILDSIPPGEYTISEDYFEYRDEFSISFRNTIVVEGGKTVETQFIIPDQIPLQVLITGFHKPGDARAIIKNATISTEPETISAVSDETGIADFGTVPIYKYKFFIQKRDFNLGYNSYHNYTYEIVNGKCETLNLRLSFFARQSPNVTILSPRDNHYQKNVNIHLFGNAYDFEDDIVPDDKLIWFSDIDGELGRGRELFIPRLNAGNHTITLVAYDTQALAGRNSIQLNLMFFDDETYYPLPYTGYWNYRYDIPVFTVFDDVRGDEHWSLADLYVTASDVDARNCSMDYTITRNSISKYCRYEVVDEYETDEENIYISKTTELLRIYNNETMSSEPIEQLEIVTVYSPRYLLMKLFSDPIPGDSYDVSCNAEVTWNYLNDKSYSQSHDEDISISTRYEFGEPVTIATSSGTYETIPLTIHSEEVERIWWLANGIGIVQLSYDSFGFPLTASLTDTNIPSFSKVSPAFDISKSAPRNGEPRIKMYSLPETPERLAELSSILRGFCPR